ncbi:DctP family TRAP transporter solute-binding subunit [Solibacillus sp. A46]|uniref:DctP family TRAP transporter solute-binding subunit n=1 Tax=Solibacillus faecavium TaxID=2762221 RepID=A0ABR8XVV6_9BACL|nr:TRAP transporter substrate-binding protein [Solibacillus faecavium]MBD8036023.1 DctP family TRAP transporter solute-binding subunit [Solibacillus faecavium]
MKKFVCVVGLVLSFALLSACTSSNEREQYVLYAGHSLAADHPFELAMQELKQRIEERTDGRVIIETFPLSQLGAERELIEGAMLGSVDMVVSTSGPIMNFVSDFAVLDLPFLFNDRESAVNILEGEIGQELFDQLRDIGIVGLSWGENGFRHVTNSLKPVETPDDLKGLSMRVQENKVFISAFKELGVTPSPMAWTEALTALQSGVVDGQENPILVIDSYKLYDANQKHMTLTGHAYSSAVFMMSEHAYNRLPEDLRQIVMEEGQKIGAYERQLVIDMEQKALARLQEQGMEVVDTIEVDAFREKIMSVYDSAKNQQLLQRILNEQ